MSRHMIALVPLLVSLACDKPPEQDPNLADLGSSGDLAATARDAGSDAAPISSQLPPIGSATELEQWLATGAYKQWACEKDPHPARSGSAHVANRICSNDLLSGSASGEFPIGSASVKELYDGSGHLIASTLTGDDFSTAAVEHGYYQFAGLKAGDVMTLAIEGLGQQRQVVHSWDPELIDS